jgi:hypothetical protein
LARGLLNGKPLWHGMLQCESVKGAKNGDEF